MSDWAPVIAVSISAPVAAIAALGGAWLQGRLSRQAAAEADARQTVRDHGTVVRTTVADLLAALDIALQAGYQLVDPPQVFTGETSPEGAGRLEMMLDEKALHELLSFARTTITTVLSKINELQVLEPQLLPNSAVGHAREVIFLFGKPTQYFATGGLDIGGLQIIVSLHDEIMNAYSAWAKSA